MPIYEYCCSTCKQETEVILPIEDIDVPQKCSRCGEIMTRVVSLPHPAVFIVTNRNRLMNTINNDDGGYKMPGANKHRKRYEEVIGRSLIR